MVLTVVLWWHLGITWEIVLWGHQRTLLLCHGDTFLSVQITLGCYGAHGRHHPVSKIMHAWCYQSTLNGVTSALCGVMSTSFTLIYNYICVIVIMCSYITVDVERFTRLNVCGFNPTEVFAEILSHCLGQKCLYIREVLIFTGKLSQYSWKPWKFSPANLSPFTVLYHNANYTVKWKNQIML